MKNSATNAQQTVDKIMTEIYENLAPKPEQRYIINHMLRLLANGSPVKPAEVAMHLQASPDKVTSTLRKFGAEFDEEGNILGLGLTLVTTPHIYKVNGHKLYTWCAGDALAFPVILKQNVHIESSDPVTGKKNSSMPFPFHQEQPPEDSFLSMVILFTLTYRFPLF
jgi:alkylmercury lyase